MIKHLQFKWDDPLPSACPVTRSTHMEVYAKQGDSEYPDGLCVIFRNVTHPHFTYTQLNEYIDVLKEMAFEMKEKGKEDVRD